MSAAEDKSMTTPAEFTVDLVAGESGPYMIVPHASLPAVAGDCGGSVTKIIVVPN
jgi:hypothetical protein